MFFFGCINNCFGMYHQDIDNDTTNTLNTICKLRIEDKESKLPLPIDKQGFIDLMKKINMSSKCVLGGSIEFIIMNQAEQPSQESSYIRYIINIRNAKTLFIVNTYYFIITLDNTDTVLLSIIPYQNEKISTSEWSFIASLFYNTGYKITRAYTDH